MTKEDLMQIYGKNIKRLREEKKITQSELSEKVGIAEKYLSTLETCKKGGSIDTLLALSNVLGVEPYELLLPQSQAARHDNARIKRLMTNFRSNLNELVNAVKEYEERCIKEKVAPTLSGYLQEISLITAAEDEGDAQNGGAVTLMTVHLAKGLEFPTVFVTGLEEGLFPLSSKDEEELEEERRLCYVAMTRAKKNLYMTYAATRRIFGKTYENFASRFLYDSGLLEAEDYQPQERQEIGFRNKPRGQYFGKYDLFSGDTSYSNA